MIKTITLNPAVANGYIKLDANMPPRDPIPPNPRKPPPKVEPLPKPKPKPKPQYSAAAKASLREAGMSDQGIMALQNGRACTDPKDQAIVSAIIAAILP